MNKRNLMFVAMFSGAVSVSAQLVTLNVLDSDVLVGETFGIEVLIDKTLVAGDAEMLSFAFDVSNSATLAFLGASVEAPFSDDSAAIPYDVGGSAFPGVTSPSFSVATLSFKALAMSEGVVSILGPVDLFGGLKYSTFLPDDPLGPIFVDEDFPIDALVRFEIGEGIIPEPSMVGFLGFGVMMAFLAVRRRR